MTDSFILVGVDAFPPSRNALCWAVDEALRRNMPLQIVTVIRPRAETEEAEARRRASDAQRHAIDAALRERTTAPRLAREVVTGDPVEVLSELSERAELLVLGAHGTFGLVHAGASSVVEGCVRLARCPVVTVPMPGPTPPAEEIVLHSVTEVVEAPS